MRFCFDMPEKGKLLNRRVNGQKTQLFQKNFRFFPNLQPAVDRQPGHRRGDSTGLLHFLLFLCLIFSLLLLFFFLGALKNNAERTYIKKKLKPRKINIFKNVQFCSAKCATYSRGFAPHKVYRRRRRFVCAFVLTCLRRENC